jgi:hypothetical protein
MTIPNRYRVTVLALGMALAAGLLLAAVLAKPAWAAETECVGTLTGVYDNVVVPPGAFCTLQGALVTGNVKVLEDATLQANASTIRGNVEGPQVRQILLQFETQVGGNLLIKGADPGTTNGFDINVHIEGNVLLEENQGRVFIDAAIVDGNLAVKNNISQGFLEVEFNTVGGNLNIEDNVVLSEMSVLGNRVTKNMQVNNNTGPTSKKVINNTVGKNLQCFENDPPFIGGPNAAQKAEGQCF